jgi:ABC-2 type transport system ATP-binding protein
MIEIKGLQKIIDQYNVIDIDHMKIDSGEIAAFIGPLGSGKTELLNLLTGQSRPTIGTVKVSGIDPHKEREQFSRQVGVLFYEDSLYKHRTSSSNLSFYCQLRGLPKSRIEEVLTKVGLLDHASVRVEKLPPNLARRLAFGCAILHQPQVIILVEPFVRCDESTITTLTNLMRSHAGEGTTVLIISDGDANLGPLCDTIHVLNNGRVIESYKPAEAQQEALPFKIPVRMEGKVALVNPGDILYADAREGRAFLHTQEGHLPTQYTLSELEKRLSRSGFFRAHRGYLVNLQHVKEVIPYTRNSFSLRLNDPNKTEIPLSKSAASELRELLGY